MDVVCGVIRDDSGRYLICLRAAGRALAGHWEFPGGKLELGESPREALTRELREELGIDVDVGEAMFAAEWTDGLASIRLLPHFCTIRAGVAKPLEHEAIQWCALGNLSSRRWAPADLPVVAALETLHAKR